jgi:hypothetical protein
MAVRPEKFPAIRRAFPAWTTSGYNRFIRRSVVRSKPLHSALRALGLLRRHAPNGGNLTQTAPSGGVPNATASGRGSLLEPLGKDFSDQSEVVRPPMSSGDLSAPAVYPKE